MENNIPATLIFAGMLLCFITPKSRRTSLEHR